MKIIFLTTVLPSWQRTGSEIASQSFINALRQNNYEVIVLGYQNKNYPQNNQTEEIAIQSRYIETQQAKYYPLLWMAWAILSNLPYSAAKYYSQAYIAKVKAIVRQEPETILIFDHAQLFWLYQSLNLSNKLILIAHNVENQLYETNYRESKNLLGKLVYQREAKLFKRIESKIGDLFEQIWTLTENDAQYFANLANYAEVYSFSLPSLLDLTPNLNQAKTTDIGIIGSWTWQANNQGLEWFFEQVYPLLPQNITISIAGKGAEWLKTRAYPNVNYQGFVPDAAEFMRQAKVIAIPAISGGGIQIKTLDAIATGVNIVATTSALRGISSYPSSIKIAPTAEDFAESLIQSIRTSQLTPMISHEAIAWSQTRRKEFINQVNRAISNL